MCGTPFSFLSPHEPHRPGETSRIPWTPGSVFPRNRKEQRVNVARVALAHTRHQDAADGDQELERGRRINSREGGDRRLRDNEKGAIGERLDVRGPRPLVDESDL